MTGRDWLTVVGVLALASLIPVIWAIIDVARRPPWQFSTGRKVTWALTLGVGWMLLWPFALVSAVVYLVVLRRRFSQASPVPPGAERFPTGAGYSYGYGYGFPPQAPVPPPQPLPLPPAGWYADPGGSGRERWWDGRGWSHHLR